MKRIFAALLALLVASPSWAQITTDPIGGQTTQLPNLVIGQTLAVGSQIAIGQNGVAGGTLTLNGLTSGQVNLVATSGGGLAIEATVGQGITLDDGTNAVLQILGAGSSAVNGLYIKNGTTGNPAVIGAAGSDSNIGIQLIAKGNNPFLGFQIINTGGVGALVPMQAGGLNSGTGVMELSGNTSGGFSIVGTPTGGHAAMTSNTTPTLGVCNGSGSSLTGSDMIGAVIGQTTGTPTSCTVTFATAFANPPFCMVTGGNQAITTYTAIASALTVNFPTKTGQTFVYYCFGL